MLFCDDCDRAYHFKCCDPVIVRPPKGRSVHPFVCKQTIKPFFLVEHLLALSWSIFHNFKVWTLAITYKKTNISCFLKIFQFKNACMFFLASFFAGWTGNCISYFKIGTLTYKWTVCLSLAKWAIKHFSWVHYVCIPVSIHKLGLLWLTYIFQYVSLRFKMYLLIVFSSHSYFSWCSDPLYRSVLYRSLGVQCLWSG